MSELRTNSPAGRAASPDCPADELAAFLTDPDGSLRQLAWANPALPVAAMESALPFLLAANSTVTWLLTQPSCPAHLLELIADGYARAEPFESPWEGRFPAHMLALVLDHPNCAPSRVAWAASHPVLQLRLRAASHPLLPRETAELLIAEGRGSSHRLLAGNLNVPVEVLRPLLHGRLTGPRLLLLLAGRFVGEERQHCLQRLVACGGKLGRLGIAEYSIDPAQVALACVDADPEVRAAGGRNAIASDADRVAVALMAEAAL